MLRNIQEYYRPVTPPGEQPPVPAPAAKGFQTIERHVDERLENETEESLGARIKADIVVMCQER
ncbi:hypothetical protein BGZ94_006611, partial [Podila epigama]